MNKEDVKIGMEVVMINDYCSLKTGEKYRVVKQQAPDLDSDYYVLSHLGEKSYLAPHHSDFEPTGPNFKPLNKTRVLSGSEYDMVFLRHRIKELELENEKLRKALYNE